jgi:hypothetical protein
MTLYVDSPPGMDALMTVRILSSFFLFKRKRRKVEGHVQVLSHLLLEKKM